MVRSAPLALLLCLGCANSGALPTERERDGSVADALAAQDTGSPPPVDAGNPPRRDARSDCGECTAGETEDGTLPCGECDEGTQPASRTCSATCSWGDWIGSGSCTTSAECGPGDADSESRACSCGTEMRSRSCDAATCRWGAFGAFTGCPAVCCGDGTCGGSETCSSCVDCQADHMGTGNNGDPCPGVPAEQWRCVTISAFGSPGSQVCRDGAWVTFNLNPRDCAACVCGYSSACML